MSVIRTSLSLITFGFTIFEFFRTIDQFQGRSAPARNFGVSLVLLGVLMLSLGIGYHAWFMVALRKTRAEMTGGGLIHGHSPYPVSLTLIIAVLLLVIGVLAVVSMVFRVGPLG
jgi:putative membrane protein